MTTSLDLSAAFSAFPRQQAGRRFLEIKVHVNQCPPTLLRGGKGCCVASQIAEDFGFGVMMCISQKKKYKNNRIAVAWQRRLHIDYSLD
eukprot:scaffold6904_cov140-Skeletonema_marinoi.AAC.5